MQLFRHAPLAAAACVLTVAAAAAAALALPARAAAEAAPVAPAWQAPTPATETSYSGEPGATLTIALAAAVPVPESMVAIRAVEPLPSGAVLTPTDGNPARATLRWAPTARQIGGYSLSFAASEAASATVSAPVVYHVRVVSAPAPRRIRLSGDGFTSRWALLLRRTAARSAPSRSAPAVTTLATVTPDRTKNVLLLLDAWTDGASEWVRVRLPVLPNNSTAWVPRNALGPFHEVATHLYVDRSRFTATLFAHGKPIFRTRVGVGTPYWPTPKGEFYVRDKLVSFEDPFYGPVAFGTNARSAVLTDWPAGGFVGIHGTDNPSILPGRVSHGCIRFRNDAILRLARLMPVGTPVTIT